ncbi:MAG: BMP family ABC transporter substrate-binding protein [Christensenellales bacterium]|nr:BMP family ABC transporter substrate-binding protein [Christensenellales bacterium]
MKKKIVALVLVIALAASLAVALAACDDQGTQSVTSFSPIAKEDIKFGLICLHDENSTYDKNFIDAAREACNDMGVELVVRTGIPESAECYDAAVSLINDGCNMIFADSFGHESYILQAAQEYPNVRFAHATGTTAHTELQANFYNAFASIYEGRYLAGIVAGYELNEMIESGKINPEQAKMGYVGAFPYAEVVSGYTSFYLGAKSVCPSVTMEVRYTGSWYDETAERNTAQALIKNGCVLISQHADSSGAPTACEEAGVPNVTYNVAFTENDTYLVGSRIDWAPYFRYYINCVINGVSAIGFDWTGHYSENADVSSVKLLEYGSGVSEEAKQAVAAAEAALAAGTLQVFDVTKFTVDDKQLTSYLADIDTDTAFTPDTQVIITDEATGITYFAESLYRSAPYFDVRIDGITEINN